MHIWRSVLSIVFMVVACSLSNTVRCDIPIGSTINILPLSLDAATVAKLSNSPSQEAWWNLTDEDWHDSAIERFFSIGPPNYSTQRAELAVRGGTKDPPPSDLMQRLQHAATTEYKMHKSITGTGDIEVSMWTLMFRCQSSTCTDGYMVPIVVVPTVGIDGKTVFAYATVWQNVTDMVLINAIPASISIPPHTLPVDPLYPSVTPVCNIHQYLPECPPVAARAFRTLLDGAYGLAPAISCVGFTDEDKSFKIVMAGSINVPEILQSLPFQQCSADSPLMMLDWPSGSSTICNNGRCIAMKNMNSSSTLSARLSYMLSVRESCLLTTATANCSAFDISVLGTSNSTSYVFRAESKWVSTQGKDDLDLQYASQSDAENVCYMLVDTGSPSTNVTPPVEIMIQALDYLTRYITEHNAAFTTEKGPATDPYTFYALIVSTTLSVITIAVPFTDLMLRAICGLWPFYLNSRNKTMKIIIQVCCNVVLGLAFLLPVLSLAINELDRQQAFDTWALASDDLVYDQIRSAAPVRVVYFFSATSKYRSPHFLNIISIVICLTCIAVAASTARRCLQVFARYALVCKDSKSQAPSASPSALMKAMTAIEMGEAEYLDLQSRVQAGDLELPTTSLPADQSRCRPSRSSKF